IWNKHKQSNTPLKRKVFVGLSGGVDSAVSAALLKEDGCDVTGVFIRIAIPGYPCTAGADKIEAQRVAAHLRIPFIEIDLSKEYQEEVFNTTIAEFAKGHTPNPDTLCNQKIKFGAFYNFAKFRGADFIATGHYGRIAKLTDSGYSDFSAEKSPEVASSSLGKPPPSVVLLSGIDGEKDQSYFLWMVPETVLRYTRFPVGSLQKSEVRALAKKFGLPNAARKDSQGLCFLGSIGIEDMLERELVLVPGEVVDEKGAVIGKHRGAIAYTLGQRHGFELFTQTGVPHFVIAKDAQKNTITVSPSSFPKGVSKTRVKLAETNWIGAVGDGLYEARFRYRQTLIPAELELSKHNAEVILQQPHYIPIGQSLVLYEGDPLRPSEARRCLGGGIIEATQLI
ncbi:MAG: tRNA 2-thiouridine(34) synthase MnmA, partial [bacterium]|nr:tRNA 2-thiouridine(34) synthase MnmA [bacterium]